MKNKYVFIDGDDSMRLGKLERVTDDRNNAVLTWEWPQSRLVKLLFIFEWTEEDTPDVETLFNHQYAVVSRELGARFTKTIHGRSKFIVVPGFFDEQKQINICKLPVETDWLFKKVNINAAATVKPIPLGHFQHVTLRVNCDDASQMERVTDIVKYAIYEQSHKVGEYPIDAQICLGACGVYIKKTQTIRFILDENYAHLYKLNAHVGGPK